MKAKKPTKIDLLRAEIKALREEIAALKATPPSVTHNHYHFGDGGLGQPARNPYVPVAPQWPNTWPIVTCDGSSKHEITTSGATFSVPGVVFLTQGVHRE